MKAILIGLGLLAVLGVFGAMNVKPRVALAVQQGCELNGVIAAEGCACIAEKVAGRVGLLDLWGLGGFRPFRSEARLQGYVNEAGASCGVPMTA